MVKRLKRRTINILLTFFTLIAIVGLTAGTYLISKHIAFANGYKTGKTVGYHAGYKSGHDKGYQNGHTDGFNDGSIFQQSVDTSNITQQTQPIIVTPPPPPAMPTYCSSSTYGTDYQFTDTYCN